MFPHGVLLTRTVSRACCAAYCVTALLAINQLWAHNAYFVKCKKTKPAQLLLGRPWGVGRPSRYLETGLTMVGASGGWECLIDSSSE